MTRIWASGAALTLTAFGARAQTYATPAYAQSISAICDAGLTCTATFPQPVAAGDTLVATLYVANTTVGSVNDLLGNTWILAKRQGRGNQNSSSELWYTVSGSDAGLNAVTGTNLGLTAPRYSEIHAYAYRGLAANALDCVAAQDVTANPAASPPCTTHVPVELVFGMANPQANVLSAGTGFALREGTNGDWDEDEVVNALGSYSAQFTLDAAGDITTLVATFKALLLDAGADAGVPDAGGPDAGGLPDAASPPDSGAAGDSGAATDAGVSEPIKGWALGCNAASGDFAAWGCALALACGAARGRRGQRSPWRQSRR